MKVVVIRTGHVGLVTAATLAEVGHDVVGIDQDEEKIELLSRGTCPFYEPGLQEIVDRGLASGRLRSVTDAADGTGDAYVVFIFVGTPVRASGSAGRDPAGSLLHRELVRGT